MPHAPRLILHGGAGRAFDDPDRIHQVRTALGRILGDLWQCLNRGSSARDVVILGCQMLEDDPLFNAGTGSAIQHDGQVRMSASLMGAASGEPPAFSGVINAMNIQHPIDLAAHLQGAPDRVLDAQGAERLARERCIPLYDPITSRRLDQWLASRGAGGVAQAKVLPPEPGVGTVGVVALDMHGGLFVGTSTGGRGFERPGRVSDSATPAGNFATSQVAVSCTGIGEDIQDECLAAKIAVRAGDGPGLEGALRRSFEEARQNGRWFGAIALDARSGHIGWAKTTDVLLAAYHDGKEAGDTLDAAAGWGMDVRG